MELLCDKDVLPSQADWPGWGEKMSKLLHNIPETTALNGCTNTDLYSDTFTVSRTRNCGNNNPTSCELLVGLAAKIEAGRHGWSLTRIGALERMLEIVRRYKGI